MACPGRWRVSGKYTSCDPKTVSLGNTLSTPLSSGVPGLSEAALHLQLDGTAIVIARGDTTGSHFRASAPPPYTKWQVSELPEVAQDHVFQSVGDRAFLASRALMRRDEALAKEIPATDEAWPYIVIYRLTNTPELRPWATVPSMGICGQPRLLETPTQILCAYSSQHEDGVVKPYLAAFDKTHFVRKR
jgi:hypothetical protein